MFVLIYCARWFLVFFSYIYYWTHICTVHIYVFLLITIILIFNRVLQEVEERRRIILQFFSNLIERRIRIELSICELAKCINKFPLIKCTYFCYSKGKGLNWGTTLYIYPEEEKNIKIFSWNFNLFNCVYVCLINGIFKKKEKI